MTIFLDPQGLRQAWQHGTNAGAELTTAGERTSAAAGTEMGDLTVCLADAAADMRGVLEVAAAVVAEHGTNVEACITEFMATDGRSAGEFRALAR